jgi:hypothetical protein
MQVVRVAVGLNDATLASPHLDVELVLVDPLYGHVVSGCTRRFTNPFFSQ